MTDESPVSRAMWIAVAASVPRHESQCDSRSHHRRTLGVDYTLRSVSPLTASMTTPGT
jgi:hypothetical protein